MNNSVAIILSVYKNERPKHLYDSLISLFTQSMQSDIYLYVDGLIPDSIADIIQEFQSRSNFFVIRCEINHGLAFALNALIDETLKKDYKYIARMDTDDLSRPERIKTQFDFMEQHLNVDVLGGFCREFGSPFALEIKKLPLDHDELKKFSITRCPFIHPTVMFRRSVFEDGNRYPTNTKFTEDMALWFSLLEKNYRFHNIPVLLLDYRLCQETVLRRRGISKAKSELSIRFKYMIKLNAFSIKTTGILFIKFFFHLLPPFIIEHAYKKYR